MKTAKIGTVRLIVDAGDPTTEIYVIDGLFRKQAEGLGQVDVNLPPGLHTVKYKASSLIDEVHVALEPGMDVVYAPRPTLRFAAAAPIQGTSTTREYHRSAAQSVSGQIHEVRGVGSQLLVFVRDVQAPGEGDPARGLMLAELHGTRLIDFTESGVRAVGDPNLDSWAGCTVQLTPGAYRLQVATGNIGLVEQIVVCSPGWQTQVFLVRGRYGFKGAPLRGDLRTASIYMAPIGRGFDPARPDLRQTELARLGLHNRRLVVNANELSSMLWAKFENPMLGIYGAHLLLLAQKPDRKRLEVVVDNLRDLVGDHPDVLALEVWLRRGDHRHVQFLSPPMLRSSWQIIVPATATRSRLVPATSLSALIADRVWGDSPWLLWQSPKDLVESGVAATARGTKQSLEALRLAVPHIADLVDARHSEPKTYANVEALQLTNLERDLLDCVTQATTGAGDQGPSVLGSAVAAPEVESSRRTNRLSDAALVRALGVPKATVGLAADGLLAKLNMTSPT